MAGLPAVSTKLFRDRHPFGMPGDLWRASKILHHGVQHQTGMLAYAPLAAASISSDEIGLRFLRHGRGRARGP